MQATGMQATGMMDQTLDPERPDAARRAARLLEEACGAAGARARPSPNWNARRGVRAPDLVVLHYTGMPTVEAALDRLCAPEAAVSAHWLITPFGALWGLAPEEVRAWHAGVSAWTRGAAADVNSRSIGIELAHPGHDAAGRCAPFPEAQMAALETLLRGIMARWSLSPSQVLAHSDVAPGRKIDPGERFDWRRLARAGLVAASPEPRPERADAPLEGGALEASIAAEMRRAGYGDWPEPALLDALRRRWRPQSRPDAPAEPQDLALAAALAARVAA